MTVTTVYGIAGDGYIEASADAGYAENYAVARAGSSIITAYSADANNVMVGQWYSANGGEFGDALWVCREGFIGFDTSGIPDTDTVSDETLSLWLLTDNSTTDFTVTARQKTWSASGLTTADWIAGASLTGQTLLATLATNGIGSTGAYKDLTSDAGFAAQVNKTGNTEIILHSDRQSGNNEPTGLEFVIWQDADYTGTTQDPKLVVTHAAGGGATNATVTGVTGTATAAGVAGSVAAIRIAAISGALATAPSAGVAGSVATVRNVAIGGVAATADAAGVVGSVATVRNASISGALATATAEGIAGAVSTGEIVNASVNGTVASADAVGIAGAADAVRIVGISGTSASASAQGAAGVLAAVQIAAITGELASASAAGAAGSVAALQIATIAGVLATADGAGIGGAVSTIQIIAIAGAVATATAEGLAGSFEVPIDAVVLGAIARATAAGIAGRTGFPGTVTARDQALYAALVFEHAAGALTRDRQINSATIHEAVIQ